MVVILVVKIPSVAGVSRQVNVVVSARLCVYAFFTMSSMMVLLDILVREAVRLVGRVRCDITC